MKTLTAIASVWIGLACACPGGWIAAIWGDYIAARGDLAKGALSVEGIPLRLDIRLRTGDVFGFVVVDNEGTASEWVGLMLETNVFICSARDGNTTIRLDASTPTLEYLCGALNVAYVTSRHWPGDEAIGQDTLYRGMEPGWISRVAALQFIVREGYRREWIYRPAAQSGFGAEGQTLR